MGDNWVKPVRKYLSGSIGERCVKKNKSFLSFGRFVSRWSSSSYSWVRFGSNQGSILHAAGLPRGVIYLGIKNITFNIWNEGEKGWWKKTFYHILCLSLSLSLSLTHHILCLSLSSSLSLSLFLFLSHSVCSVSLFLSISFPLSQFNLHKLTLF